MFHVWKFLWDLHVGHRFRAVISDWLWAKKWEITNEKETATSDNQTNQIILLAGPNDWTWLTWCDVMWCDVMWYDMIRYDTIFVSLTLFDVWGSQIFNILSCILNKSMQLRLGSILGSMLVFSITWGLFLNGLVVLVGNLVYCHRPTAIGPPPKENKQQQHNIHQPLVDHPQ